MDPPEIVLDTNVLIAALRSRRGASYRLLRLIDSGRFFVNLSVPLLLQYEEVGRRILDATPLSVDDFNAILDYLCRTSRRRRIYYLWRPFLRDSDDDMVLELAVASGRASIITFNRADFQGAEQFGIRVMTPQEFLVEIEELP